MYRWMYLTVVLVACSSNPEPQPDVDAAPEPAGRLAVIDLPVPNDLAPDGSTALIEDIGAPMVDVYFYDTATDERHVVTTTGDFERAVTGISATGVISGFHGDPIEAALWSADTDWVGLGSPNATGCDLAISDGWDVSADGTATVGLLWNGCATEPFLWREGGFVPLQALGIGGRATKIADDGSAIGGFAQTAAADRTPAVWDATSGDGVMLDPAGEVIGEVLSVSADGSRVAGIWNQDAFTWTEAGGVVDLGKLPGSLGTDSAYANAIAAGGALIFGGSGDTFGGGIHAFVWTADGGMRALEDIVAANGIEVPDGLTLANVIAASTDGTVLLGTTNDANLNQATFVLHLQTRAYGL
jgi:hypothetical protein